MRQWRVAKAFRLPDSYTAAAASQFTVSEKQMHYGSDFSTVLGQEYGRAARNAIVNAAAGWANQQIGSKNRLVQQFGVSAGMMAFSSAEALWDSFADSDGPDTRASTEQSQSNQANQNDQNRRAASMFQGWQFSRGGDGADASFDFDLVRLPERLDIPDWIPDLFNGLGEKVPLSDYLKGLIPEILRKNDSQGSRILEWVMDRLRDGSRAIKDVIDSLGKIARYLPSQGGIRAGGPGSSDKKTAWQERQETLRNLLERIQESERIRKAKSVRADEHPDLPDDQRRPTPQEKALRERSWAGARGLFYDDGGDAANSGELVSRLLVWAQENETVRRLLGNGKLAKLLKAIAPTLKGFAKILPGVGTVLSIAAAIDYIEFEYDAEGDIEEGYFRHAARQEQERLNEAFALLEREQNEVRRQKNRADSRGDREALRVLEAQEAAYKQLERKMQKTQDYLKQLEALTQRQRSGLDKDHLALQREAFVKVVLSIYGDGLMTDHDPASKEKKQYIMGLYALEYGAAKQYDLAVHDHFMQQVRFNYYDAIVPIPFLAPTANMADFWLDEGNDEVQNAHYAYSVVHLAQMEAQEFNPYLREIQLIRYMNQGEY